MFHASGVSCKLRTGFMTTSTAYLFLWTSFKAPVMLAIIHSLLCPHLEQSALDNVSLKFIIISMCGNAKKLFLGKWLVFPPTHMQTLRNWSYFFISSPPLSSSASLLGLMFPACMTFHWIDLSSLLAATSSEKVDTVWPINRSGLF